MFVSMGMVLFLVKIACDERRGSNNGGHQNLARLILFKTSAQQSLKGLDVRTCDFIDQSVLHVSVSQTVTWLEQNICCTICYFYDGFKSVSLCMHISKSLPLTSFNIK